MRSTRSIEILCLVLAALVLIWSGALIRQLWPVLGLLAAFAAAIVAFRARGFLPRRTLPKLLIESWSMLLFITGAASTRQRISMDRVLRKGYLAWAAVVIGRACGLGEAFSSCMARLTSASR